MENTTQHRTERRIRNRGGRPPLLDIERRSVKYHNAYTIAEVKEIQKKALAAGVSEPEYIRHAVLNRDFKTVPAINKETYHELGKIGVNVNQIAHSLNANGKLDSNTKAVFESFKNALMQLRKELLGVKRLDS